MFLLKEYKNNFISSGTSFSGIHFLACSPELRLYLTHAMHKCRNLSVPSFGNKFLIAWQVNTEQDGTLLRQKYKDADNKYTVYQSGKVSRHPSRRQLHPFGGWEMLSD